MDYNHTQEDINFKNPKYDWSVQEFPPNMFARNKEEEHILKFGWEKMWSSVTLDGIFTVYRRAKDWQPKKPKGTFVVITSVHTEHCCGEHRACKYGNVKCPVAKGTVPASFKCNCGW